MENLRGKVVFYSNDLFCVYMGGRLPAVAGMPAYRAFLEFPAGQSDLPKKMHVPITKIGKETYYTVTHYEVILWHNINGRLLKRSLKVEFIHPSHSWDLDTNLLCTRGKSAANSKIAQCAGKVRRPSLPNSNTG